MTKMADRVAALLAKAEATDSQEEAEALISKAQQLATIHAIDLASAQQRRQRSLRREEPTQRHVVIAEKPTHGNHERVRLFSAVATANDVKIDIAHGGGRLAVVAFGFPSDIDMVETLHASLSVQMFDAAQQAVKRGEHKAMPYYSKRTGKMRTDARVFKTSFYRGFVNAVGRRLMQARDAAIAEDDEREEQRDTGAALVLARKQDEVHEFYERKSVARGSWRPGSASAKSSAAVRAGYESGTRAKLGSNPQLPGARGELDATAA